MVQIKFVCKDVEMHKAMKEFVPWLKAVEEMDSSSIKPVFGCCSPDVSMLSQFLTVYDRKFERVWYINSFFCYFIFDSFWFILIDFISASHDIQLHPSDVKVINNRNFTCFSTNPVVVICIKKCVWNMLRLKGKCGGYLAINSCNDRVL